MEMWLCRDEDGLLHLLFEFYPTTTIYEKTIVWTNDSEHGSIEINRNMYPDVTFENSPVAVELNIKKQ